MTIQVKTVTAIAMPMVSAVSWITSRAVWMTSATIGPILATISAASMRMATAAMPAPWPPALLQHGGLHITGRLDIGSVKHATHLFS